MRSRKHFPLSTFHFSLCLRAFTLVEMLVVLGIIGLVSAITLPMLVPMMRTRTLDSAVDTVKTACNLARSTAIQQRRMMNLTFLQQTDSAHGPGIVMTPYAFAGAVTTGGSQTVITDANQGWNSSFQNCQLLLFSTPAEMKTALQSASPWNGGTAYTLGAVVSDKNALFKCVEANTGSVPPSPSWEIISSPQTRTIESNTGSTITIDQTAPEPNGAPQGPWFPQPAAGDVYAVVSSMTLSAPYCIHYLGNYGNDTLANADVRFLVLKTVSQYMGQTVQYLPTGCQFDFGSADVDPGNGYGPSHAWTYVFLPDGEVWTLTPQAQNVRNTYWFVTTYMSGTGGVGVPSGPRILGPSSPSLPAIQTGSGQLVNCLAATIVVYGTTGQVVSQ